MADNQIPDDVLEMLPEFLQESDEHLQVLNSKMLEAEAAIKTGASMSSDDLNTMFRSAHTIKGTASFIGLKKVVALTHKAETLLQRLRDGEMSLTAQCVDALFAAFDKLNSLLTVLKESKTEGVEIDVEVQKIEMILNPGAAQAAPQPVAPPPPPPPPPPPKPEPVAVVKAEGQDEGIVEKYLEHFIPEAQQNIDDLNDYLVTVEQGKASNDIVNDIFRVMHTLKGSSGLINAKAIAEVAHKMETILSYFREQGKPLPPTMIAVLLKGADAIKAMVESLKATRKISYDIVPICKELDKTSIKIVLEMKTAAAPAAVAAAPKIAVPAPAVKSQDPVVDWTKLSAAQRSTISSEVEQGKDVFLIEGLVAAKEALKSMRLAMITERLGKNGKVVISFPPGDEADAIKTDALITVLFCSNVNESNIREILAMDSFTVKTVEKADDVFIKSLTGDKVMEKVPDPEPVRAQEARPAAPTATATPLAPVREEPHKQTPAEAKAAANTPIEISTVKIDARKLDKLMNLSGELVIIRSQYARLVGLFNNDLVRQKELVRAMDRSMTLLAELEKDLVAFSAAGSADPARIQKMLEGLKSGFQHMVSLFSQEDIIDNTHTLSETTSSLEKTASDLQASVMQTRMVPVEGVFTRFKRIVRDISKDLNKEVNLKIEGAETELDKKIVDGLGDPLTHMIRNAVDHGLEDRETRVKIGKPEAGTILLKASHKGNSMCIEISDDGKGMDPEKIAAVAVKKGVISQEQSSRLTDKEKVNLIFLPGFSTAEKVTGLSGRGVGMDVVRSMIASFNGVVDIDTKIGEGSTFVLKIPLTLAIIQALLVTVGGEVYALPLDAVTEIIKVPAKDIYSVDGNATVKLRNHALSLIELEKVIKVSPNKQSDEEYKRLVIVTDGESRLGVLVDSLLGKDEIVIKSFTKHFARVKGVIGASILADGNVALILDPATIIKESR
jgi:two-component system chemotaxis sensor kinase CheA